MKRYLIGNWKQNPITRKEALALFADLKTDLAKLKHVVPVVCAPALFLSPLRDSYRGKKIALGAQDCGMETSGAHTGETSAAALKDLGMEYVILGHSERRAEGESSSVVAKKIRAAMSQHLTPVVCIGETERDNDGSFFEAIKEQLTDTLWGITAPDITKLVIAYEPVWAIGKGGALTVDPQIVHETTIYIRTLLTRKYDRTTAFSVPILYGGSVTDENAAELSDRTGIQGFLVGGASLKPAAFIKIGRVLDTATL